jgi:hypothetical protein
MQKFACLLISLFMSNQASAWQTTIQNSQYGPIHVAWQQSTTDASVSIVVSCAQGQQNATVSMSTENLVVGLPNHTEHLIYGVGKGSTEAQGSGPASIYARIREDGMGFYIGEGKQGLSMSAMLANNDWMKVYWQFVAPSRGELLKNLLGQPSAKPQRNYTFDLRGFSQASSRMALACGWSTSPRH